MKKRTTKITANQLRELTALVRTVASWPAGRGRPIRLSLEQQVKLTCSYLRTNVTQHMLGEIYRVSQPTVSRVIAAMTPLLGWLLETFVLDPQEASKGTTLLIDGTLVPCWSWASAPELYSGKHHTTGHNLQVAADLNGRLVYVSPPLPGRTHDTQAFRHHDLATSLTSVATGNAIGDKGYQGCGIISPIKKPPKAELTDAQKTTNRTINGLRAAIERVIANIKTWRILHTDYRRPLVTFEDTLNAVRGLIFFQQSTPL